MYYYSGDIMSEKVLIAMSGGVDSSVVAYLMKQKGYDLLGITLKLHDEKMNMTDESGCCTSQDIEDAKSVAKLLNIDYSVLDFESNFKDIVIKNFIDMYENGATPNPCVVCNRYIKFDKLLEEGEKLGCKYVATGHYARVSFDDKSGRYLLKKGLDNSKDQSYVLYSLTQSQLSHVLLPLGEMSKDDVRKIALDNALINADKSDSQDICFIPDGDYASFIEKYTNKKYPHGDVLDMQGNVLGEHRGLIHYTIGQRKGLGLALCKPMYVCDIDTKNNTVTLGDNEDLFKKELFATNINLISVQKISGVMRVKAKVRYKHTEQWASVTQIDDDTLHIVFDEPQRAFTKGQSVVMYDGDVVVGGGIISKY